MLSKFTVTFAPAGTVIVLMLKAMFCATRLIVIADGVVEVDVDEVVEVLDVVLELVVDVVLVELAALQAPATSKLVSNRPISIHK